MKEPGDIDDTVVAEADRRDNRRAILVAVVGILIVGIASGVRMAAEPHSNDIAVPKPSPTALSQRVELPTAAFHGNGTDGEHGENTPFVQYDHYGVRGIPFQTAR